MKLTLKDKLEAQQKASKQEPAEAGTTDVPDRRPGGAVCLQSDNDSPCAESPKTDHRPVVASAQVVKAARNKNYVYASLDGERISVLCRGRDRDRIIGKRINVLVSEFDGKPIYEHQP